MKSMTNFTAEDSEIRDVAHVWSKEPRRVRVKGGGDVVTEAKRRAAEVDSLLRRFLARDLG